MVQLREEEEESAPPHSEEPAVEQSTTADETGEGGQNVASRTPAELKSPTMPRIEEEEESAG